MQQIIYIVTAGNKSIEVWKLLNTGKMFLIQIIDTDNGEGQTITILQKRKKIYVGIRPYYKILIYDILKNGKLKKIDKINIPYSPHYLITDAQEEFLFCSYYHAGCMNISYINNKHIPTTIVKNFYGLEGCHSVNIDLSNNFVFFPALLQDRIYCYNFQDFKNKKNIFFDTLKYVNCLEKSGPRHMALHPNKKYIYNINELNGTIDVWKIYNIKKNIQHIQNIQLFPKNNKNQYWSSDIHITSCGKYLYASDRLHNTITLFQINKHYTLSMVNNFYTAKQPKSFIIDEKNKFLISIGQVSNTVMVHNISKKNGFLNTLYEYSVGNNPTWITIHTI
ncbi:beta-propeller fold lactonase family protein [Buchnera aphidicola]|uniref:beta-propeller fold lactonase family protein n=1 Tax=Buchnera aphidicola TaxID=9 RepID=UPI003464D4CA